MLARRIATFLIGAWIGCGVLMAVLMLQSSRAVDLAVAAARETPAGRFMVDLGLTNSERLMTFQVAKWTTDQIATWEVTQLLLGAALGIALVVLGHRKILPLALCGAMFALVVVQYTMLTPELSARSLDALFADGDTVDDRSAPVPQIPATTGAYTVAEVVKLLLGGVLASYLFAQSNGSRSKGRRRASDRTGAVTTGRGVGS